MKKMLLLAAMMAIAALMMAATPAFAQDNNNDVCDIFNCNRNDFCNFFDCNNFFVPGIEQTNEQNVESGDATQNFNVTGGGANSNQTVGVQPIANTGNATNNTSVFQAGDPFPDGNINGNDICDFFNCNNNRNDVCDIFNCNNNNDVFDHGFGFGGGNVEVNDAGNLTISPSQVVGGNQQVNQAAAASATLWPWWTVH